MRSELEKYELIDRYLNHQLVGEELSIFEQNLESNLAFRQEVEDHSLIHNLVVDHGLLELRKKLRALDPPPATGTGFVKWGAVITVIAIVSAVVFYSFRDDSKTSEVIPAEQEKVKEQASSSGIKTQDDNSRQQPAVKQQQPDPGILLDTITSAAITPVLKKDLQTEQPIQRTDTLKVQKSLTRETTSSHTSEIECDLHLSEIIITTVESCYNTPGGKIIIDERSDLKGKSPFAFSIDHSHYFPEYIFTDLFAGSYELTVRDANDCHWTYDQAIRIDEKDCKASEYSIYPAQGEVWKIPVDGNTNGRIEIYNKTGMLVFSAEIMNGLPDTWDGTSNGQSLPMGSYSFILKSGKNVLTGTVTVIR